MANAGVIISESDIQIPLPNGQKVLIDLVRHEDLCRVDC